MCYFKTLSVVKIYTASWFNKQMSMNC